MPEYYSIIIPLLMPMLAATLCIFCWQYLKIQRWIYFFATLTNVVMAVQLLRYCGAGKIIAMQSGNWQAPFGITLVADGLAAIMVFMASLLFFIIFFYIKGNIDKKRLNSGFYPLLLFLQFGVLGAFFTGDLFNLYVWFEVMLMASFVLVALGKDKAQLEGAIKYVTINFIASMLFLAGIAVVYGIAGTTNMADLSTKIHDVDPVLATVASIFFLVSFGIKSALFPMYFWLPASYHTPPITISALIAGLLTKVGVYALLRVFTLIFTQDVGFTHEILLWISAFTMLSGVLGAIAQSDFRKILSFHIVSQIGYMIMGLALYTPLAIAGAVFYIVHHIVVKTNLFLIAGLVAKIKGSFRLSALGGVYAAFPFVALLFAISAFSLAGIPPLSGFWGKFTLAQAGLESERFYIVGVALFAGLLTLFSMVKIWTQVFLNKAPEEAPVPLYETQRQFLRNEYAMIIPSCILVLFTLFLTFYPEPLLQLAKLTAAQLMNPENYINAVMGR